MKKKGKYLGEMLVKKGLITENQLQEIIQEQLRNKKFIGEMFVEKGIINMRPSRNSLILTMCP
jgi:type IV pilus assembly protein PilB